MRSGVAEWFDALTGSESAMQKQDMAMAMQCSENAFALNVARKVIGESGAVPLAARASPIAAAFRRWVR